MSNRENDHRMYTRRSHPSDPRARPEPWRAEGPRRFRDEHPAPSASDYGGEYDREYRREEGERGFGDPSRYAGEDGYYDHGGERYASHRPARREPGFDADQYDRTWSHRPERRDDPREHRDWRSASAEPFERDDWRYYGDQPTRAYEEHRGHGDGLVEKVKNFFGVGPKNYQRSDARILEDANDELFHDDRLDASRVEVKVENGVATLEGAVDGRWAKWRAEDRVERVGGVREVRNHLRIDANAGYSEESSILRYAGGAKGDELPSGLGAQANLDSLAAMSSADDAASATGTAALTGMGGAANDLVANEGSDLAARPEETEEEVVNTEEADGTFGARGLEGITTTGGFDNTVAVRPERKDRSAS